MASTWSWRILQAVSAIAIFAVIGVACGGGGGDDDDAGDATTAAEPTRSSGGSGSAGCPSLPYSVVLKAARGATIGNDDQSFRVTSSRAVSLAGGAGYTIYLANYDIPAGEVGGLSAPVPPDGKTLITIFLTTFNAQGTPAIIKEGDNIAYETEFNKLTFRVITQVGAESFNSNTAAQGSFKVTATGDHICGEIDYSDSASGDLAAVQNQLKGTIGAEVKK